MKANNKLSQIALATSAAALFATAALSGCTTTGGESGLTQTASAATGHCVGVNACKGHSDCKTADNSCKGQNACKGQGFVELNESTCDQVGGNFQGA